MGEILEIPKHAWTDQEIHNDITKLEVGGCIGEGGFAFVRIARFIKNENEKTESYIAIKCIYKGTDSENPTFNNRLKREVAVLAECVGIAFVAQMKFDIDTKFYRFIGLEYCPGKDLCTLLSDIGVNRHDAMIYIAEIAIALYYLHSHHIVYHDLKPENVCFDAKSHVKLVDFGLAKILTDEDYNEETGRRQVVTTGGTIEYSAPELFWRLPHAYESDWWSFGVLAYELLCGSHPFDTAGSPEAKGELICSNTQFSRNDIVSVNSTEESFLSMFLQKKQEHRFGYGTIQIKTLMRHGFFDGFDWRKASSRQLELEFKARHHDVSKLFS